MTLLKFAEQIPDDAIVIMQLEGDKEFNAWARRLAKIRQSEGHPIAFVKIEKLKLLRPGLRSSSWRRWLGLELFLTA